MQRPSIVFFSNHVWASKRRAGFHGLASAFSNAGWDVAFVATGLSQLSRLKRDRRLDGTKPEDFNEFRYQSGVNSYLLVPLFHPVTIGHPLLERFANPVFARYGSRLPQNLEDRLASADVVVFESSAALFLVPRVRQVSKGVKIVYRVSDDVRIIKNNKLVIQAELDAIDHIDLISVPSRQLKEKFPSARSAFHPHGLDYNVFNVDMANPYDKTDRSIAVSVGSTLFDYDFFDVASKECPDVDFHIVGDVEDRWRRANVILHGEVTFEEAAAFSAHCDIALAPYRLTPGFEYLAETSNKIMQYRYLARPIVTNDPIAQIIRLPQVFGYNNSIPGSTKAAINAALNFETSTLLHDKPPSWNDVRDLILTAIA